MKTAFCILTCLLFMGCATQTRTAEPSPQKKTQTDDAKKQFEEERKVEKAIGKLGGTAFSQCPWVDGLMVIVRKEKFTDADLERLAQFPQILGLDLSGTQITDAGLKHLKVFTKLRRLELNETRITDAGLEQFGGLTELERLFLDDTTVTDEGLKHLKGLTKLEWVYLNNTQITDKGLDYLKDLPKLDWLELEHTRITDAGLQKLKGRTKFERLVLDGTKITDAGLAHLQGMTQLELLYIRDTQVTDTGLGPLRGLAHLRWLELSGTRVTGDGVRKLSKALRKCEINQTEFFGDNGAQALARRGDEMASKGEYDKAIADYNEAIKLCPDCTYVFSDRASAWVGKGEYDKALADCNEAIELSPRYADAYGNRGITWAAKGDYDKAIADYVRAITLNSNGWMYYNRGDAWAAKCDYVNAIADYDRAIKYDSLFQRAYCHRGDARYKNREYETAIADYSQAIKLDPKDAKAANALGWLEATCADARFRDGKKAVENARIACQLTGEKKWDYIATLAASYAESGDFDKAREWQTKAIETAPDGKIKQELRSRLELYKRNKPYRDEPKMWQDLRVALVDMVTAGKHEELKMALPHLRSDPIIADGDDCISIGKWRVKIKDRKFVVTVDAGPIFAEYSGKLTQNENGAWRAEITSEKHN